MIDITYHKEGDYLIPDLYLEENYKKDYHIGKYGYLRLEYLKSNKKAEYSIMLLDGTLRKHIVDWIVNTFLYNFYKDTFKF